MICVHCGYCCIMLDAMIIKDIDKPISEDNIEHKPSGEPCKHLIFEHGVYWCKIHKNPKYKDTPCFAYTQIELVEESICRMGEHIGFNLDIKKMLKEKFDKNGSNNNKG